MFWRMGLLSFLLVFNSGCKNIPSDPNGSFEKAIETGLSVGYSVNPPWVTTNDSTAGGIEGSLIKSFAGKMDMKIVWHYGSEQELMKKLEKKELHVVISGLTKDNPWKDRKIGFTLPYFKDKKEKHVIAVQQGENKLLQNIELYLFENKDSIKRSIYAAKQKI
jgi:hypothetical protein